MRTHATWLLTALLAAAAPAPAAKPPKVQWTKTFAGWGTASGRCVQQTSDGGYIAVGSTNSRDSAARFAALLVKLDASGVTQWVKTIKADGVRAASSVVQTSDGGYIVVGTGRETYRSPLGAVLVRTDDCGNVLWRSYLGHDRSAGAASVVGLDDTACTVVVRSSGDSAVILWGIENGGAFRWSHKYPVGYGLQAMDEVLSLHRTSDGGYVVGTKTLLKVDSLGAQPSLRTFGSVLSANSVIQTSDGGYAATGAKLGYSSIYLLKTNANRDSVWMRTYAPSECSRGRWVEQTADGGYVTAGTTRPVDGDMVTLVRTLSDGTLDWTVTLFDGDGDCVRQTTDGGYIVCGRSWSCGPDGAGAGRLFVTKLAPERKSKVK